MNDRRSTGGNDVNFAMNAPKADSPDIAVLRSKGVIISNMKTLIRTGGGSDRRVYLQIPGGDQRQVFGEYAESPFEEFPSLPLG